MKEILINKIKDILVTIKYSGLDAINIIQDNISYFDLILIDINMLPINGIDSAIKIRELGFGGIILGVTRMLDDRSLLEAQKAGFNNVIAKPINIEKLLEELKKNFNIDFQ